MGIGVRRFRCNKRFGMMLVALVMASSGCGDASSEHGPPKDLSLIWISLDTLRADHLGMYGYGRDTSPFMDRLAERGTKFEWVVTPQNSTLPTHLTMFSGFHPVVHGVYHSRHNPGVRLAPGVRTLPEVLRDAGFDTQAWVDGGKMAGYYGFSSGFRRYQEEPSPFPQKLRAALAALDERKPGQPFFYLIHTYEIHSPYEPPAAYAEMFVGDGDRDQAARDRDAYDGSIRFVDDQLKKFVRELRRRGVLENCILTITGDHGENFDEYGIANTGHGGNNLHQNITRVPWFIVPPTGQSGRGTIDGFRGLIDFPNTMLGLLGLDERLLGGGVDALEAGAGQYVSFSGQAWSLYAGGYHLLESEAHPGVERNALFDVRVDPSERSPLPASERQIEMLKELRAARTRLEAERDARQSELQEGGDLPEETRDQLRALGYAAD